MTPEEVEEMKERQDNLQAKLEDIERGVRELSDKIDLALNMLGEQDSVD